MALKNRIYEAVCVTISVLIIIFFSCAMSQYVRSAADRTQNQIIKNLLSLDEADHAISLSGNKRIFDLAGKYAVAYVDCVVEDQEIQLIDTGVFASFYLSLPNSITVESFKIDSNRLSAVCFCENADEIKSFKEKLLAVDRFSGVSFSDIGEENGTHKFTVEIYIVD